MSNSATFSFTEPITEPEILASIEALPTEDDLQELAGQERQRANQAEQLLEAYRQRFGELK